MFVEQFVDAGLGNSSYLVGSEESGVAVVIDPTRDAEIFARLALEKGVRITHVLETHLHADFVSGSRELAARTGAIICASAAADLQFEHKPLREGDKIEVADLIFQVMETPGHSPEHISFLAVEPGTGRPIALFSGGALIVGGAARTDLLGPEQTRPLAHQLYHTMREKLSVLPDDLAVYPTHGSGSFCVAPASDERVTTLRAERRSNPLLRASSEEAFVERALEGLPSYPTYFNRLRAVNQRGPSVLGGAPILPPLSPQEVKRLMEEGALVVDTRPGPAYASGHIPGSYGVPLRDAFATWVGWVVPPDRPLIIVSSGRETHHEIARQLVGIGYDNLAGFLEGCIAAWGGEAGFPVSSIEVVNVSELKERLASPDPPLVLDVRQDSEWADGHIPGAVHIEGGSLPQETDELPRDRTIAAHCGSHSRSATALSVLERQGFQKLALIHDGWSAWEKAGYKVEKPKSAGDKS
ncbi:MAG: MBL fold metallo-hydrolase [Dehalococcoidia bacterium]|nr:MBL fold metallo-hydrolase [Dehalococcoidia bacterium]